MSILGMFADKILGPADESTGQRPGDPTGASSIALGMGGAALGAATATAISPDVLANIRGGMEGFISGGRTGASDPFALSSTTATSVPAVAKAATPDLPAMG